MPACSSRWHRKKLCRTKQCHDKMEELPKQRRTALAYGKCRTTGTIVLHTTSIQALHPCLGRSPRTRSHEPHERTDRASPPGPLDISCGIRIVRDKARLPGNWYITYPRPCRNTPAKPGVPRQNPVYGSALRDEALVLEALVRMNRRDEALAQARHISESLKNENSFDTQSTAFALMAMGHLAGQLSGTLEFTWQAGEGQEKQSIHSAKAAFITQLPKAERGTVTLTNLGEGAIEAAIITRTRPVEDTLPAQSNGLGIKVQYADAAGRPIAPADGIRQGSDITATVTISNLSATQDYSHLALTHLLPSGWEIQGERADTGNASAGYDYPGYTR